MAKRNMKKKLKKKVQRQGSASKLGAPVVESARDVWLAGLGALNIAREESGKIIEQGSKLFDKLVEEGGKFENKARHELEDAVTDLRGEVKGRMSGVRERTDAVRKQAADNWDKLEKIFEERVARALASLGIPTSDDINGLSQRVEALAAQVRSLDSSAPVAKKPAPKKAASKKAASKKAPAKKASAKKVTRKSAGTSKKKAVKKAGVKKSGTRKSPAENS